MPIITPTFPCMNSSHNISTSTKAVILTEIEKGALITEAIIQGQHVPWNRLFKKFSFFRAYEHFIQITILSTTSDVHEKYLGFAESKIKFLLGDLEKFDKHSNGPNGALEFRPWPTSYKIKAEITSQYTVNDVYFIGIRVRAGVEIHKDVYDFT